MSIKNINNILNKTGNFLNKLSKRLPNEKLARSFFCKLIVIVALLVIAISFIAIYVKVASYSVLAADDYIHWTQIRDLDTFIQGDDLHNAIEYAKWDCVHLGGRYSAMFIQAFFGPKPGVDYITNHMRFMTTNMCIFFFSIFLLCFSIIHNLTMNISKIIDQILVAIIIGLSFIIVFNGFNYYGEAYNWFSGVNSYTLPLSFFMISFALNLFLINYKNPIIIIISLFTTIIGMGGSLSVVIPAILISSATIVIIAIMKKINIYILVSLLQYFVFGFINFISPGNFIRRNVSVGKNFSLLDTLRLTIEAIKIRCNVQYNKTIMIVLLIIFGAIVACSIAYYTKFSIKYYIFSIFLLLLPILAALPILVGYETVDKFTGTKRMSFILDFMLYINYLNISVIFFSLIINFFCLFSKENTKVLCIPLSIVCLILGYFIFNNKYKDMTFNKNLDQIVVLEMFDDLYNKKYENYHKKFVEITNYLEENRGNKNVSINNIPNYIKNYCNINMKGAGGFYQIANID